MDLLIINSLYEELNILAKDRNYVFITINLSVSILREYRPSYIKMSMK